MQRACNTVGAYRYYNGRRVKGYAFRWPDSSAASDDDDDDDGRSQTYLYYNNIILWVEIHGQRGARDLLSSAAAAARTVNYKTWPRVYRCAARLLLLLQLTWNPSITKVAWILINRFFFFFPTTIIIITFYSFLRTRIICIL